MKSKAKKGNRLTLSFATANFPEDYLPYTATYSRNKDPYLVWDSGFTVDSTNDGHYHHTSASIDSHSPASLNHYHMQSHNHLYPTCSASSASWPSAKKRRCCGLSCGCCALTMLALVIISALATVVGFSIYLAMITNLHKSSQLRFNGSFKVDSGDNFNLKLINTSSPEFIRKANKYETIIKTAFETSELNNAITKPEVYAFRKGSLIVFFRLYLDRRKADSVIDSQTRDDDKNKGFDEAIAVKLIQRDLRDGISQLKITGTEQIIIDIKSIQVMNELESMADKSVNDIKTSGIASNKALAPMRGKDSKQLSNKSSDSQPKANTSDKNKNTMNITTNSLNTTLPSLTKANTTSASQPEPDVRNASNTPTNTANTVSLISSTLLPTTHSSTHMTTHSYNESELNVFTSNKSNYKSTNPEIKSTTVPPKSEHKNPFLPFTRRQSTAPAVTTPSISSTNVRLTTRSRLRTTTTPLPTPVSSTTSSPVSVQPQPSNEPTNVLLKRTELRDDGLRVSGLDFGQWKPVVTQPSKPLPKPLPPKPIPPPMISQPLFPPNQIPHNLGPLLRPPPIGPQYMPNRHPIRIPIGIPMREVPRLLDNEPQNYPELTEKDIERKNISIISSTVSTTTPSPSTTTTTTSVKTSSTRSPRQTSTTTTSEPTLVDGFMVPQSITKAESSLQKPTNKSDIPLNEYNRELRRNKSLGISDEKPITKSSEDKDYSSHSLTTPLPTLSAHLSEAPDSRIQELSIGSPVLHFANPSTNVSKEKTRKFNSNESEVRSNGQSVNQTPNSLEPTLDSNSSQELHKTKSPFDYYSVINETLFSQTPNPETTANITSPSMSSIIGSTHQMIRDVSSADPNLRRVSTTTPLPDIEMIAGLPIGVDRSDPTVPQKLIRPMGSSEPLYGERLPKYIPPALYQKYPTNDIISTGSDTQNDGEIADEALYDDEVIPLNHSTIDVINIFSLTTTPSQGLETTTTACLDNEFQCTSGQCVSARAHCNRRFECDDRSDENQCNCALYLKADRQHKKICDGVVDCEDQSDEIDCSYCHDNYVCAQSHQCIDKSKVCNGENDCPNGDDETECISLVPNDQTLDTTGRYFNSKGALYIRRKGEWAPLCLDDINMANDLDSQRDRRTEDIWKMDDLGKAICRANSYSDLQSVRLISLSNHNSNLFFKIEDTNDRISPSLSMWSSLFERSECLSKRTAYVECKQFECGVRPQHSGIRRRIVGGQSASHGSWPWQVALYREGEFQCGGVIVDSQWLLTAAHCFHATRDAYWTARFGILRRGNVFTGPYEQLRRITHVIVHKDYVDKGFINDIALLRLDKPIDYSKHVRPVCMPSEQDDVSKWHRQLCTTVGWGKLFEHGRIFPDTLQEVRLPVISTEECRKRTLFLPLYKITDNMFCAGYDRGGRDACLGDSGGPLMCQKRNGKWFLLGVTSNGDGCGRAGRPGVYTKVAKYMDWIETTINSDLEPEVKRLCDGLRCPLGRCLKRDSICNGIIECRDGSDEQNCMDFNVEKFENKSETYFNT